MFSNKKWMTLIAVVAIAAMVLPACAPPATPEVIIKEVPVEKKVIETVIVEKEVAVEKEVVKTVVVEKEVEKEVKVEVVVTATPVPPTPVPPKKKLEGLWYPLGTEPPTLDIQLATDTTSHLIIHQCIEGLFEYRGDGSIEPRGATGFTVSDDGLVYTIKLRKDAVWSDGVPVVAQHFVDGVVRLMLPETAAEYAWLMYDIEGAEEFNTGEIDDPELLGVKAVDDYTFEVTLKAPTPLVVGVLSAVARLILDVLYAYLDPRIRYDAAPSMGFR